VLQVLAGGDVCALPASKLQQIGSVAYGLSVADIACLQEVDEDSVAALGSLHGWTQAQVGWPL